MKFVLSKVLLNFLSRPDFISYDIRALPNRKVERLRKHKLVLGWTINSKEKLEKAKKYCDNYIFENMEDMK